MHIDYKLTPAVIHNHNWSERAIQTFKNHFLEGLLSTDPNSPLSLWCKLVAQYVITINLLQHSIINPNLSAHTQVFSNFNYYHTTMSPPGINVLRHERAEDYN